MLGTLGQSPFSALYSLGLWAALSRGFDAPLSPHAGTEEEPGQGFLPFCLSLSMSRVAAVPCVLSIL